MIKISCRRHRCRHCGRHAELDGVGRAGNRQRPRRRTGLLRAVGGATPSSSNFPKKEGPYRIALANGYIANTWRIQMIQTAKAYAAQPDVAAKLKEFKVVSTGEDVPAQISAINNFIDSGYDAIVVNAQNPTAFAPVIKRAKEAGVVLVAFDNILDTEDAINVNVDQKGLGVLWANWLVKHMPERRQDPRGARRRRHLGRHRPPQRHPRDARRFRQEVGRRRGRWASGTIRPRRRRPPTPSPCTRQFDGITAQGGDTGVVQAMIDAKHPMVPFGGETENGFRKFCAQVCGRRAEMLVGRHRPGAGRGRDQDGDRRARGQGRAAVGQAAAGDRRGPQLQGRPGLLPRPVRQFLRRQFLPDLRHQLHRAGNHGADQGKPVSLAGRRMIDRDAARRPQRRLPRDRWRDERSRPRPPLFRMEGVSKRYGGVRALEKAELTVEGRPHSCHPRRERRRQVDADQDHGRRRRARRGPHDARRPARSPSPRRPRPAAPASPASSRNCR